MSNKNFQKVSSPDEERNHIKSTSSNFQQRKKDQNAKDGDDEDEVIDKPCVKIPIGGIMALMGGFFIQLTLGSFYSFGNVMTYMTSYMRAHGSPNVTYQDFIIVQSVWGMTQGTIMPISGILIRFIGPRVAMFGGCFIFSFGTAMTYFTVKSTLPYVALTYGFIQAFGQSIALIPTMTIGMKWFPKNKGIAMGIVVGGFGGGSFIFNQITTAILNPDNISVDKNTEYFTDPALLDRVPNLMLILSGIYFSIQMVACFMVTEPPNCKAVPELNSDHVTNSESMSVKKGDANEEERSELVDDKSKLSNLSGLEALKCKEFYILWLTRFSVVLITQTIAGFYKVFGQSFIKDDHFFALVGAVSSLFNCSGRLMYGLLMDKTTYRTAMMTETLILALLMSTLILTTLGGKIMYAMWVWAIFLTFPGTYSTQPAVTVQTFGHKHGGMIYGFLFTSDIVNNLLVGVLSKPIYENFGYLGLFLILACFALFATGLTLFFPSHPNPKLMMDKLNKRNYNRGTEGISEHSVKLNGHTEDIQSSTKL